MATAELEHPEDLAQRVMEVMLTSLRNGRVDDLELLDRYVLGVCRNVAHTLRRSGERTAKVVQRLASEPEQVRAEVL